MSRDWQLLMDLEIRSVSWDFELDQVAKKIREKLEELHEPAEFLLEIKSFRVTKQ